MTLQWFEPVSNAKLSDAEFLKSIGITIRQPRFESIFRREEGTNNFVCDAGVIFACTDGRVIVTPTTDAGEHAKEILLQIALDCIELEHHKRFRWLYKRKTSKRPGYWFATVWIKVPPGGSRHQALASCESLLKSGRQIAQSHTELAPELFESPKELA